MMISVKKY